MAVELGIFVSNNCFQMLPIFEVVAQNCLKMEYKFSSNWIGKFCNWIGTMTYIFNTANSDHTDCRSRSEYFIEVNWDNNKHYSFMLQQNNFKMSAITQMANHSIIQSKNIRGFKLNYLFDKKNEQTLFHLQTKIRNDSK